MWRLLPSGLYCQLPGFPRPGEQLNFANTNANARIDKRLAIMYNGS